MENTATRIKWVIDPAHSEVAFKVKYLMVTNVKGVFKDFDASIYTAGEDFLTAEVDFWMHAGSVDTRDEQRDAHLKSVDFFDAEHYPQIHFRSTDYEVVDNDGSYELYGDLTIKGITKKLKLDVEFGGVVKDLWGNEMAGIKINGKINRHDWNLHWNASLETGGVLVGESVNISCELHLVRQS